MNERVCVEGGSILEDSTTAIMVALELLVNLHTVRVQLVSIHATSVNVRVVAQVTLEFILQQKNPN